MSQVTVFLPVYNAEQFLEECMVSILYQSYDDFDILIVDDGSTDKSVEIIRSFNDERIRFIQNNHNYIETINMAFSESTGKYIARMDSDDRMLLTRLERQVKYMNQHPELFVCTGLAQCFGGSEHIYGSCFNTTEDLLFEMLNGNPIVHPTAMFRKDFIVKHKLSYKEQYIYGEDFRLWYEISTLQPEKKRMAVIPEILINYRVSETQVSAVKTPYQYQAIQNKQVDYFHLISGMDFPVRNENEFLSFFEKQKGKEFLGYHTLPTPNWENGTWIRFEYFWPYDIINVKTEKGHNRCTRMIEWQKKHKIKRLPPSSFDTLFGGSGWFSLSTSCITYILEYSPQKSALYRRLKYTFAPEETYFPTIVLNSPFAKNTINDNLRYIDWNYRNGNIPANLDEKDYPAIIESTAFFARKFDYPVSQRLVSLLKKTI